MTLLRGHVFFRLFLDFIKRIHKDVLNAVFFSPIQFFESNPVGRILNRFSADQSLVDDILPSNLYEVLQFSLLVFFTFSLIAVVNYWTLISLAIAIPFFFWCRKKFVSSSRQIKRIDGVSQGSIISLISSSFEGLVSIRSFGNSESALLKFMNNINQQNRTHLAF